MNLSHKVFLNIYKMLYIYFIYCYFKRRILRTGVQNKNNPDKSKCVCTFIYLCGITKVSRWINNRFNWCNWQRMPLFTIPILELLQRLVLYKTSAYTSSKAHPIWALSEKTCADLFIIVCCFPDTNVAGLENYIALKLDLRTVGVDRYYVPATR